MDYIHACWAIQSAVNAGLLQLSKAVNAHNQLNDLVKASYTVTFGYELSLCRKPFAVYIDGTKYVGTTLAEAITSAHEALIEQPIPAYV